MKRSKLIRWSDNARRTVLPPCRCAAIYSYRRGKLWKCKACVAPIQRHGWNDLRKPQASPSATTCLAIAIFVNGAKGHSALQLSRDLDCQYRTAFVLSHKLREALAAEMKDREVSGDVEIDGAYFGGYVKPANHKENRRDRRLWKNQSGKRRCAVIMRERDRIVAALRLPL